LAAGIFCDIWPSKNGDGELIYRAYVKKGTEDQGFWTHAFYFSMKKGADTGVGSKKSLLGVGFGYHLIRKLE